MKRELKDYLHLYLGCKLKNKTGTVTLMSVIVEIVPNTNWGIAVLNGNQSYTTQLGDYKPLLRPLSDMTEEEVYEYDEIHAKGESVADTDTKFGEIVVGNPECFLWLLSKHFDLFGLIEAGLAIDETKVQVSDTTMLNQGTKS